MRPPVGRSERITTMDETAANALIDLLREAYGELLTTERARLIEVATTSLRGQLRGTDEREP
jgi:hypothetical protein